MKTSIAALALLALASSALAQTWSKEPDSFLGIKLGSKMPPPTTCSKKHDNKKCYWESPENHVIEFDAKGPEIGIAYKLVVREFEGQVSQITMTPANEYERGQILKILAEKFGPPTSVNTDFGQSHATGTFWTGKHVSMHTFATDRVFYVSVTEDNLFRQATSLWNKHLEDSETAKVRKAATKF